MQFAMPGPSAATIARASARPGLSTPAGACSRDLARNRLLTGTTTCQVEVRAAVGAAFFVLSVVYVVQTVRRLVGG